MIFIKFSRNIIIILAASLVIIKPIEVRGDGDPLIIKTRAGDYHSVVDYRNQVIEVEGMGASRGGIMSLARKRIWALEEARKVAYLRLAETMGDLRLEGRSTLAGSELVNTEVRTSISKFVRGAQVVHENIVEMQDGSILAKVRLRMLLTGDDGIIRFISDKLISSRSGRQRSKRYPETDKRTERITGLVLDAGQNRITPALAPNILLPDGQKVFSWREAEDDWIRKWGYIHYVTDLSSLEERIGRNPLIVRITPENRRGSSDLIINREDGPELMNCPSRMWRECRVVVLLQPAE